MRLRQLEEGVRYGAKQREEILSNLNDFAFGFEIEMVSPHDDIGDDFDDYIMDHYRDVEIHYNNFDDLAEHILQTSDITINDIDDEYENFRPLNSDYINNLIETLDLNVDFSTMDMFNEDKLLRIIDVLLEQIHENGATQASTEINAVANNLNSYTVMYGLQSSDDIDIDDLTRKQIDELVELYRNYITVLRNLINNLDTLPIIYQDGELRDIDDLSDVEIQSLNAFFESENIIEDLIESLEKIAAHPLYNDDIRFDVDHDYSDKSNILVEYMNYVMDVPNESFFTLGKIIDELEISWYILVVEMINSGSELFDEARDTFESNSLGDYDTFFENNILPELDSSNYNVETEHDGQIEIITRKPVSGNDILEHYKEMKLIIELLMGHGFRTASDSGLHMSISFKGGDKPINTSKFIILSGLYKLLPEDDSMVRNHVDNIFTYVSSNIERVFNEITSKSIDSMSNVISDYMSTHLSIADISVSSKWYSINFDHYRSQNGRVELRFFGGESYEDKLDQYFNILLKLMYILKVSTYDTHDNEYYKEMYKIVNHVFNGEYGMDVDSARYNYRLVKKALKQLGVDTIGDIYPMIENLWKDTLKDDKSYVMDTLEYIEDDELRAYIMPETMRTLKLLLQHKSK